MTFPFVETGELEVSDPEAIVDDNTIGVVRAEYGEHLRGDALFDLRRLRRAIIAYEERFETETGAEVALVEHPGDVDGPPLLALVPHGGFREAVVLAPRWPNHPPLDADELVQEGDPHGE